jgi:hypothetical protein
MCVLSLSLMADVIALNTVAPVGADNWRCWAILGPLIPGEWPDQMARAGR